MPNEAVTRDDWKVSSMPESHATIRVNRPFSAEEMERIKLGFRPHDMDDRWFIYFEKDRLYIHRSWTGFCIYIVRFENKGEDYMACEIQASRNTNQYRADSESYDEHLAFWIIDFILLGRMDARMPRQKFS